MITLGLDAKSVDIALILESSYPYILGGVSAWVHQIIKSFPQYSFALIFLGGSPEHYKDGIRYEIPDNVTHFQTNYLFQDEKRQAPNTHLAGNKCAFAFIKEMHESFQLMQGNAGTFLGDVCVFMNDPNQLNYDQFLYSKESWDFICEKYTEQCDDSSFIDYFWTIKNIHQPLWKLAKVVTRLPKIKVAHTISTGYAGLLSFFIKQHLGYPVILTEHGIYTKERKIDIFLSTIFRDDLDRSLTESSYLRDLWDRYFLTLSKLTYEVANPIISLFSNANLVQIEDGAPKEKTRIIPNGVDINRYKKLRRSFEEREDIVCFVGRLVPMKDVKGFIRAIPYLNSQLPHLKFWIVGSTDQDPEYAEECHELVENINIQDIVAFKPHLEMEEVLPKIRVLVLSAIRESMPLILLESMASGVPVVATDTGACSEMILGATKEHYPPAGIVVKVADTRGLEQAILTIVTQGLLWKEMSQAGILRAEQYYNLELMVQGYQELYQGIVI